MLHLDGRTLEGGGQLLRISLCLAALTGESVRISDIRGNRSGGGGLKAQHLACVRWLAEATDAQTSGAELKSKALTFAPRRKARAASPAYEKTSSPASGEQSTTTTFGARLDIGSPGSIGLALQAILPFILFSPPLLDAASASASASASGQSGIVQLTITGGTNVSGSPSYEYISQVLLPTLSAIGLPPVDCLLERRGWSTGTSCIGSVTFKIRPLSPGQRLRGFSIPSAAARKGSQQARPSRLDATVLAPPAHFDQFKAALTASAQLHFGARFSPTGPRPNLAFTFHDSGHAKRLYVLLVATVPDGGRDRKLGRDVLYEKKFRPDGVFSSPAAEMADSVASALAAEVGSGALVDAHMRDQLVVFQTLAQGRSEVWGGEDEDGDGCCATEPSLHLRTAEWVAGEMLGVKFDNGAGNGIGFAAGQVGREMGTAEISSDERDAGDVEEVADEGLTAELERVRV